MKARDTHRNGIIPEHVSATRSNYRSDQKGKRLFQFESKEFFDFSKDDVNDSIYAQFEFDKDDGNDDDQFAFKPRDFSAMIDEDVFRKHLIELLEEDIEVAIGGKKAIVDYYSNENSTEIFVALDKLIPSLIISKMV